jgi:hypothetical protein
VSLGLQRRYGQSRDERSNGHRPQTNGKVERFNLTLKWEWEGIGRPVGWPGWSERREGEAMTAERRARAIWEGTLLEGRDACTFMFPKLAVGGCRCVRGAISASTRDQFAPARPARGSAGPP